MAKQNAKKRRVRVNRVKGVASRGGTGKRGVASRGFFRRWKWVLIPVVVLLLIPAA